MQRGGEERSEWKESAPHDAFERCSLLHYLCCLSRVFNRPDPQTTSPNSLLNQVSFLTLIIKCSTRWRTVGVRREINVTLITGAFYIYLEREGLVSWDWHSTTPHISLQVLYLELTCASPCRDDMVFGMEDEFESERK